MGFSYLQNADVQLQILEQKDTPWLPLFPIASKYRCGPLHGRRALTHGQSSKTTEEKVMPLEVGRGGGVSADTRLLEALEKALHQGATIPTPVLWWCTGHHHCHQQRRFKSQSEGLEPYLA